MPFNRNSDERGSGGIFRVLIGTGIGVAAALVLALIMTCAALSARDPAALLLPLSMAALIIGAVVSGALSSVGGGAVSGLLGGALYVLVFWVISRFSGGTPGRSVVFCGCFSDIPGVFLRRFSAVSPSRAGKDRRERSASGAARKVPRQWREKEPTAEEGGNNQRTTAGRGEVLKNGTFVQIRRIPLRV